MNLSNNKVQTYLGFAIKARKIVFGADDILKTKRQKVILASKNLSEASLQKIETFANTKNIPLIIVDNQTFLSVFGEKNIKVIAITDEGLASAIIKSTT